MLHKQTKLQRSALCRVWQPRLVALRLEGMKVKAKLPMDSPSLHSNRIRCAPQIICLATSTVSNVGYISMPVKREIWGLPFFVCLLCKIPICLASMFAVTWNKLFIAFVLGVKWSQSIETRHTISITAIPQQSSEKRAFLESTFLLWIQQVEPYTTSTPYFESLFPHPDNFEALCPVGTEFSKKWNISTVGPVILALNAQSMIYIEGTPLLLKVM